MAAQEYRVTEVNQLAERLVLEGHPERETIVKRKDVRKVFRHNLQQYLLALQDLHQVIRSMKWGAYFCFLLINYYSS